ncbi:hypothetical protein EVAR_68549_1 [Eumeta japonica]|uniref:Uncharacterized protein n=1 Tax=Eumeta variegata TaxID=151549 RepID=A0A4C2A2Y5_EUMVA|nr:hypothetical protein EVAR_68549_1 [Eumeta japonica]
MCSLIGRRIGLSLSDPSPQSSGIYIQEYVRNVAIAQMQVFFELPVVTIVLNIFSALSLIQSSRFPSFLYQGGVASTGSARNKDRQYNMLGMLLVLPYNTSSTFSPPRKSSAFQHR